MRIKSAASNALDATRLLADMGIANAITAMAGEQVVLRIQDYRQVPDAVAALEQHAGADVRDVWAIEPCDVVLDLTHKI
jgi:hypothetical protein